MEIKDGMKSFYARDRCEWRTWLQKHHEKEKSIWLIIYKQSATTKSVTYPEAVEEALCFGWIDSKPNKRDDDSFYQFFAKRNPSSNWSKINKDRVQKLIDQGLMTTAGIAVIEQAKANGKWKALDDIENLILPDDLKRMLAANKEAAVHFEVFPRSVKKGILEWVLNAKTKETRDKRIQETVTLAANNIRANQYKPKK
jgi:uncharacterized protein YdeI (YjbR/CyaY-like superfamily)